ncbi:hypothetical protein AB205_0134560 [Aquarana catesbeiana]|uniref:Uncharacterized protein n=2 Tax=Aquarana catesbeiana TaxID=8400 RepID=A0A2G9R6I8_AQUCT|nr:hypothetical protein AB205_0134560 [Aquarana catesbeiana]
MDAGALVWDTRTPFLLGGPHRCSSVYYRGVSICEACTKQVSIQALQRTKIFLHLGTLPKQIIVPHFQTMFHIPISAIKYLCAKYTYFFHIGEKRLGEHHSSEETTDPPPPEEREIPQTRPEEEGDVIEIVTTAGDRDVVEEECHFTSESAQILIGEIMGCNRDLENIKQNINDVQNKMKNIIDVLGRI